MILRHIPILAVFWLAACHSAAQAGIIYENGDNVVGAGNSISGITPLGSEGIGPGPVWMGEDFTLTAGSNVDSITFNAWNLQTAGLPTSIEWQVFSDVAGLPGAVIASGDATTFSTVSRGTRSGGAGTFDVLDFTVDLDLTLAADTYWIGLHANSPVERATGWSIHNVGTSVGHAAVVSVDNGLTWQTATSPHVYNFSLQGSAAVPEPGSVSLVGLLAFGLILRHRKRELA